MTLLDALCCALTALVVIDISRTVASIMRTSKRISVLRAEFAASEYLAWTEKVAKGIKMPSVRVPKTPPALDSPLSIKDLSPSPTGRAVGPVFVKPPVFGDIS